MASAPRQKGTSRTGDLALIFASEGFTLLTTLAPTQMAARLGITDLQSQTASEADRAELRLVLRGARFVDLVLDIVWDFFIGTAFIPPGIAMRRVRGLGFAWGIAAVGTWRAPHRAQCLDLSSAAEQAGTVGHRSVLRRALARPQRPAFVHGASGPRGLTLKSGIWAAESTRYSVFADFTCS